MYNRYDGRTGRFVRVGEPEPELRRRAAAPEPMRPVVKPEEPARRVQKTPPFHNGGGIGGLLPFGNLQEALGGLLPKVLPDGLETEDLLLLLVLYLMYKESGDKELLIILGAMFLL